MNVSELIEELQKKDPDMEVWMPCPTGGYMRCTSVDTDIKRDPYQSEFDEHVVMLG